MLNRYPDQARARRGYALVGLLFAAFGLAMAIFGSYFGAILGLALALLLIVPALCCGHASFARYEKRLSWLATLGNL
ncbi:MAG: hypothetical protein NDI93_20140 [Pseudomonas sp.]|nr:hypothetical protein [Pseudomonas sp.]